MPLAIRPATDTDIPLLGQMNRHLFEDAGSHNPMSVAELQERMTHWLRSDDWHIATFAENDATVGYAVFQIRPDSYDPAVEFAYVRQFYIEREWRRKGFGRAAFDLLTRTHFRPPCKVVIDALATDPNATAFWAALGFAPYSITMMLHYGMGHE
jgi:GNAT superfamily N-acetyltransferase